MGVVTINSERSTSSPEYPSLTKNAPPPQYYGSLSPLASPPPDQPPKSKIYEEGLADRRIWENWFVALAGPFKDGAEYWSAQRSLPKPGSCYVRQGKISVIGRLVAWPRSEFLLLLIFDASRSPIIALAGTVINSNYSWCWGAAHGFGLDVRS